MAVSRCAVMETYNSVVKYDLSWTIHGFSKDHRDLRSAEFSPLPSIPVKFAISSTRYRNNDCNFIRELDFNLERCSDEHFSESLKLQFKIKIIGTDGFEWIDSSDNSYYFIHKQKQIALLNTNSRTISLERKRHFNSVDVVIVNCHFEFFGHEVITKSNECSPKCIPSQKPSVLSSDFKTLFETQTLCDLKIRVDGYILKAHQAVLAARSPVLKTMLNSSCLETKTKCLVITDVDFEVFECFLKYLYSGEIEDETFTTAWNLYPLADKYDVPSLQDSCGDIFVSNLSVSNVCSVLVLSYLHSDNFLQNSAIRFISTKLREVKSKREWKDIIKAYPELASEVLDYIVGDFKFPK